MNCFCFHIKKGISVEDAWQELEIAGFPLLYSSEEFGGDKEIYGYIPASLSIESLPSILKSVASITEAKLHIDWTEQWALHSPEFQEGMVHVDLQEFGSKRILHLQPGPGFGDLSHPTTRLVLKMMRHRMQGQHVIDIGCGSGILALTAAALEAQSVFAIDIDSSAIEHAKKNAVLNQMGDKVRFFLPEEFLLPSDVKSVVVLMNMIRSEQKQAWEALPMLHELPGESLVSGILPLERAAYLQQCQGWGWREVEEIEEQGWAAFCFKRS